MFYFPRTIPDIVALMLRMALGALFVWTGWQKAQNPIGFLDNIRSFHLLDDPYAAWVAMGLPWLEIAAGAALVTGVIIEGGLALIAGMLAVFLWAIVYSMQRGLDINCGCFGGSAQTSDYRELITRDVVLLVLALALLAHRWWQYGKQKRMRLAAPQPALITDH
jgi:putative oxidoreductase